MPIPTWSVIADNEIDPESPITTSLMFRLRDNVLAVLGIDPADPAPVFTIPPSVAKAELNDIFYAAASGAAVATAEMIVSVLADDVEWIELAHSGYQATDDVPDLTVGGVSPHVGSLSLPGSGNPSALVGSTELSLIDVIYSSGVPTGVRIASRTKRAVYSTSAWTISAADVTVTLANTWQTIHANFSGSVDLQAKARATATEVYLQLRTNAGIYSRDFIDIPFNRRSFKSKAAV
jgi:hypothetical protein